MVTDAIFKALQVYGIAIVISVLVAVLIKVLVSLTGRMEKTKPSTYRRNRLPDRTRRSRRGCRCAVGGDLRGHRPAPHLAHCTNQSRLGSRRARRPTFITYAGAYGPRPQIKGAKHAQTIQGYCQRTRVRRQRAGTHCRPGGALSPTLPPLSFRWPQQGVPPAQPAGGTARATAAAGAGDELAGMGGVVVEVDVKVGQTVAAGDRLLVLEAMKMKTPVMATRAGQVTRVLVAPGDAVEGGQPLVTIA
jgi:biotin carboxyl carrier protein